MQNILELNGVTKHYKDFTLESVDLALPAGCIMGLIGENGAGKSTAIKLILGLIKRDAGRIRLFGREAYQEDKATFEHIGVVLDEPGLHETLRAGEVDATLRRIYSTWDSEKFKTLCARFGVPMKKQIKEYSHGMKRKLSIAAALSHDSKLLLLDEATSGLDPVVRDELQDVFLEFIQDETHGILLSSHILSDLEKISDYIALLHGGKLVFSEQKDVLLERFCVLKCSESELKDISPALIHGVRRNRFGVEALVERNCLNRGYVVDAAGIEDIMLFFARGEQK